MSIEIKGTDAMARYLQHKILETMNKQTVFAFLAPPRPPLTRWQHVALLWNRWVRWPFNRARHALGGHCDRRCTVDW